VHQTSNNVTILSVQSQTVEGKHIVFQGKTLIQNTNLLYEVVSKIFRTGAAIYTAVVVARSTGRCRTTMTSKSVCQVTSTRSWVDVGSFHTRFFGVVYLTCGDFHDESEKGTANASNFVPILEKVLWRPSQ
jgi:hypothetical protein